MEINPHFIQYCLFSSIKVCKEEAATRQREILLFEALTQFMKKSALHSINEIVG